MIVIVNVIVTVTVNVNVNVSAHPPVHDLLVHVPYVITPIYTYITYSDHVFVMQI